jgi:CheY-like chemotaxis protein
MVVLYVDNDPDDVEFFREAVMSIVPGCTCLTAGNGQAALEILKQVKPDVVFLDVNMPVMDGKETLKALKRDARLSAIPVHILSTTTSRQEHDIFLKLGATSCLAKPTTFSGLRSLIRPVLIELTTNNTALCNEQRTTAPSRRLAGN